MKIINIGLLYKKIVPLLLVFVFSFTSIVGSVSAISSEQKEVFSGGVGYFDVERGCVTSSSSSGTTVLVGSDNLEKIFQFYLSKGLTKEQAAGIAGNAQAESGANPESVSPSGYRGLFQWDKNNRWPRLETWAQEKGLDPLSLEAQLEFSWEEATERGNDTGIKEQTTVDLAAWYWGRFYEIAIIGGSTSETPLTNVQHLERRIDYAKQILTKYGGVTPSASTSGAQGCNAVTIGGNTQFIDGFTVYSQYDPAWKDLPYASSTIGVSGCGPSAMAMIITNLTGERVTPVETSNYAAEKNLYVPGVGSSWSIGPVLAEHWNLKAEVVDRSVAAITAALQEGKLVITPGQGPKPFSSGGHFIVIRAVTSDGKFRVGDSGHSDTSDKDWDPEQIVNNMRSGGIYAISK